MLTNAFAAALCGFMMFVNLRFERYSGACLMAFCAGLNVSGFIYSWTLRRVICESNRIIEEESGAQ